MVVVMHEGASDIQIQKVIDRLTELGFDVHRSTGASQTVLGAVGVRPDYDPREFELLEGVREVVRITQPYKLASRAFRSEGSIIDVGRGVKFGGAEVIVKSITCAASSSSHVSGIEIGAPGTPRGE